ncbi:MAG: transcriptional repressor [Candidatus Saganbacteria bacterium]|nr:transcriptional repressor [Candidatus Saganbacteria bacterium]
MEQLQKRLKEMDIRPSYHRVKILEYLDKHRTHPTVDQIYEALKKELPTVSKTTVYNTLELFQKEGVIGNLTISGSETRYDFESKAHSHFMCKKCGKIIDIEKVDCPCENNKIIKGNRIDEVHLYFKGICKNCLKEDR